MITKYHYLIPLKIKPMKTINLFFFLLLSLSAFAQSHPKNIPAASGQLLAEPAYGVSLNIPAGWTATEYAEGYLLQKQGEQGIILLGSHEAKNIQELQSEAMKGIQEDGVILSPKGTPANFQNKGVMTFLSGTLQGKPAEAYAMAIMSPNGGGLLIIAIQEGQLSNTLPIASHAIANSFTVKKIDKSSELQEWIQYLKGARLTYMDSYSSNTPGGGGYSTTKKLDLCSDGNFRYYSSDLSSFGDLGGYTGGKDYAGGTWKIISEGPNIYLMIYPQGGEPQSHHLTYPENKTHLNGERWFVTRHSDGPDYAPSCY